MRNTEKYDQGTFIENWNALVDAIIKKNPKQAKNFHKFQKNRGHCFAFASSYIDSVAEDYEAEFFEYLKYVNSLGVTDFLRLAEICLAANSNSFALSENEKEVFIKTQALNDFVKKIKEIQNYQHIENAKIYWNNSAHIICRMSQLSKKIQENNLFRLNSDENEKFLLLTIKDHAFAITIKRNEKGQPEYFLYDSNRKNKYSKKELMHLLQIRILKNYSSKGLNEKNDFIEFGVQLLNKRENNHRFESINKILMEISALGDHDLGMLLISFQNQKISWQSAAAQIKKILLARYHDQINLIERVESLIGPDFNSVESAAITTFGDQHSRMHLAAYLNQVEKIEAYVQQGDDLNITNSNQHTPLHIAVDRDSRESVIALIDKGATVSPQDKMGKTPLFMACENNNKDMVELLLENNADIYQPAKNMKNVFQISYEQENSRILQLLITRAGADLDIADNGFGQIQFFLLVTQLIHLPYEKFLKSCAALKEKFPKAQEKFFSKEKNIIFFLELYKKHLDNARTKNSGSFTFFTKAKEDLNKKYTSDMIAVSKFIFYLRKNTVKIPANSFCIDSPNNKSGLFGQDNLSKILNQNLLLPSNYELHSLTSF